MRAATKKVQREMALAAAEKRRRWDRASRTWKKKANVMSDEDGPACQGNATNFTGNATQKATAARSGPEGSIVVLDGNIAPTSAAAAGATFANVRSV